LNVYEAVTTRRAVRGFTDRPVPTEVLERYSALGVAREDWEARQRAAIANWDCFGAPAALFCYIDRDLGLPQ
jgi:hypothetical protein